MTTGEDGGDLVPATNENNDQDYDDLEISEKALQAEEDMYGAKVSDIDTSDIKSKDFIKERHSEEIEFLHDNEVDS